MDPEKTFTTKGTKQHEEPLARPRRAIFPFLPCVRLRGLWDHLLLCNRCVLCADLSW